jgi:hypothetical protein
MSRSFLGFVEDALEAELSAGLGRADGSVREGSLLPVSAFRPFVGLRKRLLLSRLYWAPPFGFPYVVSFLRRCAPPAAKDDMMIQWCRIWGDNPRASV